MVPSFSDRLLSALGISVAAEDAYRAALAGTPLTAGEAASELTRAGLAHETSTGFVLAPPHVALDAWARERAAEETTARASALELQHAYDEYAATRIASTPVRVLHGVATVLRTASELTLGAKHSVHELIRGPFLSGPEPALPEEQPAVLDRGVTYRCVYASSLLADPAVLDLVHQSIAAGEHARAIGDIPLRLMVVDDERALVVLPHPAVEPHGLHAADSDALLIEPSPMLDALIRLFHDTWDRATPLASTVATEADESRGLLTLLALGMTDAAIARTLGLSERTIHRRIAALASDFGVSGRFQLGVEAERRGLLS